MRQFDVFGMSCAACSQKVEKAVSKLPGVTECSVNLLTNSMSVAGSADDNEIISAVVSAGYNASLKGKSTASDNSADTSAHKEIRALKVRLFVSAGFLFFLMYISMGHVMFNLPLPDFFTGNFLAIGLAQMLLTICIIVLNKKFFTNGFSALIRLSPNMDSLIALGSSAAFVYSTIILFIMTKNPQHSYLHELYFESAAMILTLITFGKLLEAHQAGKTTSALEKLIDLTPKTAILEVSGVEQTIPAKDIKKGDIFIVKPGMSFPADGIILSGNCAVDESALTGESIPVDKSVGDIVSCATINKSGFVRVKAEKTGEDTTLSQIIKLVSDASASKAPIAKLADKVSGVFVPVVILIALLSTFVWLLLGKDIGFSLARGISVLVISCPCALGLATPVAIMVSSGIGARHGILFKSAIAIEQAGKITTVALDKTGTITRGKPTVTDIIECDGVTDLFALAYSLEVKSEHPLARAIVERAEEQNTPLIDSENFSISSGHGLEADIDGFHIMGGNLNFISKNTTIPDDFKKTCENLSKSGKTPLYFSKDDTFLGVIAVADAVKEDSRDAISDLKALGLRVAMITGDNETTANAVKALVNLDEVYAGVTPSQKAEVIEHLKKSGPVAMVGDGINDAPALTGADIGIAIGSGTDIAIDAADIVLMKSSLSDVFAAVRLSRMTLKTIKENLFWAFVYNCLGIPIAAGVLIPFGIQLNPMLGAAFMSLSSVCVVTNALRLNLKNIYNTKKNRTTEVKNMEITLRVEGMMCPHCEARVKTALEAVDGVTEVIPSHTKKTVVIKLFKEVDVSVLKEAITTEGYKVID